MFGEMDVHTPEPLATLHTTAKKIKTTIFLAAPCLAQTGFFGCYDFHCAQELMHEPFKAFHLGVNLVHPLLHCIFLEWLSGFALFSCLPGSRRAGAASRFRQANLFRLFRACACRDRLRRTWMFYCASSLVLA